MSTLLDLRAEVADALRQPIDEQSRFTTARIDRALNRAYVNFAKASECFLRTATLTTEANKASLTLPTDFTHITDVLYDNTPLTPDTATMLDLVEAGWRTATAGTPTKWLSGSAASIVLYPAPSTAGKTVLVTGSVTPSDETSGIPLLKVTTDVPQLPYLYQHALALGAIADLGAFYFADDQSLQPTIQLALAQFTEMAKAYKADLVTEGAYRG